MLPTFNLHSLLPIKHPHLHHVFPCLRRKTFCGTIKVIVSTIVILTSLTGGVSPNLSSVVSPGTGVDDVKIPRLYP